MQSEPRGLERLLVEDGIAKTEKLRHPFSLNRPTGPIQFISCDVHLSVTCPRLETPLSGGLECSGQNNMLF